MMNKKVKTRGSYPKEKIYNWQGTKATRINQGFIRIPKEEEEEEDGKKERERVLFKSKQNKREREREKRFSFSNQSRENIINEVIISH